MSQRRRVRFDTVLLHERSELVGNLCQSLSSLEEKQWVILSLSSSPLSLPLLSPSPPPLSLLSYCFPLLLTLSFFIFPSPSLCPNSPTLPLYILFMVHVTTRNIIKKKKKYAHYFFYTCTLYVYIIIVDREFKTLSMVNLMLKIINAHVYYTSTWDPLLSKIHVF